MSLQDITSYYVDRLVFQYRTQPKARAWVGLLAKQAVADYFANDVQEAFNPDTAQGTALDILGKYVGAVRTVGTPVAKPFFRFIDASTETLPYVGEHGFTDMTDPTVNSDAIFYEIGFQEYQNTALPDSQFRTFLKMMIFRNRNSGSLKAINIFLATFFSNYVQVKDNFDMTLTYAVSTLTPLDQTAIAAYLPRPMGVGINILSMTPVLTPATAGGTRLSGGSVVTVSSGTVVASLTGGTAPFIYLWALSDIAWTNTWGPSPPTSYGWYSSGVNGAIVYATMTGNAYANSVATFSCAISCRVTDANGFSFQTPPSVVQLTARFSAP